MQGRRRRADLVVRGADKRSSVQRWPDASDPFRVPAQRPNAVSEAKGQISRHGTERAAAHDVDTSQTLMVLSRLALTT